jgi:Xaa-Pro aminopeptidase
METLDPATLDRFRAAQRLAYQCAEAVAAELCPDDSERDAARRMEDWLRARGVTDWLHRPFAWFGDRTAFLGFRTWLAFLPTGRRLRPGMPFILDCAPVVDGHTADIGYAAALGENPIVERLLDDLAAHRELIVAQVTARRPLGAIYDAVVDLARRQGHTIRHKKYPLGVLGHRVEVLPARTPGPTLARFGLRSLTAFARGALAGVSPVWNGQIGADQPLAPGVWAVEPHLAFRDVGAKFEELLVVDARGRAQWLDDDLPHVRRLRRAPDKTVAA